jgi:MFS family permease
MLRLREYHLQLPFFHIDTGKNLRLLYGARVARDLVNKLALFFLPIFLFQIGSTAPELLQLPLTSFQKGMLTIAAYYFLGQLVVLITALPMGNIAARITHERAFIFSYLVRTVVFSLLLMHEYSLWLVAGAALLDGLQSNLFWNSYHTILSQVTKKKNMGKDLGFLQFLLQLVTVLSPAIAGLTAHILGIEILFMFAIVVTLFAGVLTLFMKLKTERDTVSFAEFMSWMKEKEFRTLSLAFTGRYINDAALFIWPLYVFFILGSLERVGYLYALSLFLAMVFTFFIGMYIDTHKGRRPLFFSGGVLSLLWVIRTQIWGAWSIALVDMADRLTSNVHWLYFDTIFIRRGKGSQALSYFVYREMIISFAGILFWILFGVLFIFSAGWSALFILAAIGVLLSALINDRQLPKS